MCLCGLQATINPFVASFVNYLCTLHLHKVTVTNQTFFSWQGALLSLMHCHAGLLSACVLGRGAQPAV